MHSAPYPSILILGRDTCEDTVKSRAHLDARGIPYEYRNVEFEAEADALNRSYHDGTRVTPTILIGDPRTRLSSSPSRATTSSSAIVEAAAQA